jgi:hypothetical protein
MSLMRGPSALKRRHRTLKIRVVHFDNDKPSIDNPVGQCHAAAYYCSEQSNNSDTHTEIPNPYFHYQ